MVSHIWRDEAAPDMGHPFFLVPYLLRAQSSSQLKVLTSYNRELEKGRHARLWQGVSHDRTLYPPGDRPHLD